jgi:hypothetical protein
LDIAWLVLSFGHEFLDFGLFLKRGLSKYGYQRPVIEAPFALKAYLLSIKFRRKLILLGKAYDPSSRMLAS